MPGSLAPLHAGFLPLISDVFDGLGQTVDEPRAARLVAWLDLLVTWNQKIDLTAARTHRELVDLMLADALILARHEAPRANVVDVGSGAGGPGLALWLARPDLSLTLVEPLTKRVSFLRTVVGQLGKAPGETSSIRVERGKGEEVADRGAKFDSAVARATLAPEAWLGLGDRLTTPTGAVWVLLAREPAPDLPGWSVEIDETYKWPLTGAERRAVRYRRAPAS